MSMPLKPPPPYCTARPFHSVGKLTWNLIGGALGSSGAISPSTRQCCGSAGWSGPLVGTASAEAATSDAPWILASPEGIPIADAGIVPLSAAHAAAGSTLASCPAQAASSIVKLTTIPDLVFIGSL